MERISTGVEGLDDMLGGGFPANETIAVMGPFGTGKTIFGLQFVYTGLIKGESAVYISLDESEEELTQTAANMGWDLLPYIKENKFVLIKLDASDIKATLTQVQSDLPSLIDSFKPKRVVIDPITLLEALFNDESERQTQVFNLCHAIRKNGATIVLMSGTDKDNIYASKFGLVEYVAGGAIVLRHVRSDNLQKVTMAIEIVKMRRAEHSREIKPYSITNNGLTVYAYDQLP